MATMTIPDMTAELNQKIAELKQKNVTVFERYTPEDIQRATERAEEFLRAFNPTEAGLTTEDFSALAKMLAMYDLRMLEQMFESTQGEL